MNTARPLNSSYNRVVVTESGKEAISKLLAKRDRKKSKEQFDHDPHRSVTFKKNNKSLFRVSNISNKISAFNMTQDQNTDSSLQKNTDTYKQDTIDDTSPTKGINTLMQNCVIKQNYPGNVMKKSTENSMPFPSEFTKKKRHHNGVSSSNQIPQGHVNNKLIQSEKLTDIKNNAQMSSLITNNPIQTKTGYSLLLRAKSNSPGRALASGIYLPPVLTSIPEGPPVLNNLMNNDTIKANFFGSGDFSIQAENNRKMTQVSETIVTNTAINFDSDDSSEEIQMMPKFKDSLGFVKKDKNSTFYMSAQDHVKNQNTRDYKLAMNNLDDPVQTYHRRIGMLHNENRQAQKNLMIGINKVVEKNKEVCNKLTEDIEDVNKSLKTETKYFNNFYKTEYEIEQRRCKRLKNRFKILFTQNFEYDTTKVPIRDKQIDYTKYKRGFERIEGVTSSMYSQS